MYCSSNSVREKEMKRKRVGIVIKEDNRKGEPYEKEEKDEGEDESYEKNKEKGKDEW